MMNENVTEPNVLAAICDDYAAMRRTMMASSLELASEG